MRPFVKQIGDAGTVDRHLEKFGADRTPFAVSEKMVAPVHVEDHFCCSGNAVVRTDDGSKRTGRLNAPTHRLPKPFFHDHLACQTVGRLAAFARIDQFVAKPSFSHAIVQSTDFSAESRSGFADIVNAGQPRRQRFEFVCREEPRSRSRELPFDQIGNGRSKPVRCQVTCNLSCVGKVQPQRQPPSQAR